MNLCTVPTGLLTFQRCVETEFPKWRESHEGFTKMHISTDGTIDEDGVGMLQASVVSVI